MTTDLDRLLALVAAAPSIPLDQIDAGLEPGTIVAEQFRVDAKIGAGGMGSVYRARDLVLGRDVALKIVRRPGEASALLEAEAQNTARLNHANVVTLYQVCRHEGRVVLVLELLRGETLGDRLERGSLALEEALTLAREVAAGLAHAHALGVTHRDLNPRNVFLTEDGHVKLLDFGLSTRAEVTEHRGGTPGFMAPEQVAGAPCGPATDVFAAGSLLYLSLVGTLPFRRTPSDQAPNLPYDLVRQSPRLQSLFDAMLATDPSERIADGDALESALESVQHSLASTRRRRRWRRVLGAVASVAVVVAATAGAFTWLQSGPDDDDLEDVLGRWRSRNSHVGSVLITRDPKGGYRWLQVEDEVVDVPTTTKFRNEGVITVTKTDRGYRFQANTADVEGWCCDNLGVVVFEVHDEDTLHIISSEWWVEPIRFTQMNYDFYYHRVRE